MFCGRVALRRALVRCTADERDLRGDPARVIEEERERLVQEARLSRRGDADGRARDPPREVVLEVLFQVFLVPECGRNVRDHDRPQAEAAVGVVVVDWREGMEGVLGMRMRVVLGAAFLSRLGRRSARCRKDVLGAEMKRTSTDPVERAEPGESDPSEEDGVHPEEGETLLCGDEGGDGGAGHRLWGDAAVGEGDMDGEEDGKCGDRLDEDEIAAGLEEANVESGVDAAELVEAVFRKREDLLDPANGVFSRERRGRSPDVA